MKNEKGSSLLVVLVTILILFTLAITLSSMTLSTRLQFNKTEHANVATDIAEMGITHFQSMVEKRVQTANNEAFAKTSDFQIKNTFTDNKGNIISKPTEFELNTEYQKHFCHNFKSFFDTNKSKPISIKDEVQYELTMQELIGDCLNTSEMKLSFNSNGLYEKENEKVNGVITISKLNSSSDPQIPNTEVPKKDQFKNIVSTTISLPQNGHSFTRDASTFFEKTVEINGYNKPFIINGNAFFNAKVTLNGNVIFKVDGDVFFSNFSMIPDKVNSKNICITGQSYYIENGKLSSFDFPANNCSKPIDHDLTKYGWTSKQKPISVTYN